MKPKELSREELAASMGIDLSHLTEEEIEVFNFDQMFYKSNTNIHEAIRVVF